MSQWIGDTSQTQILVNIIIWEWNNFDHVYCNNKIIYDYIEHTLNTLYLWPDSDQTGCRGSQKTLVAATTSLEYERQARDIVQVSFPTPSLHLLKSLVALSPFINTVANHSACHMAIQIFAK